MLEAHAGALRLYGTAEEDLPWPLLCTLPILAAAAGGTGGAMRSSSVGASLRLAGRMLCVKGWSLALQFYP